jgi:hypothetical protein
MGFGKNKIQNRANFINRETYVAFKEKFPDSKITYEQFILILKESTSTIRDHILDNPLGFKLPYNLGYIAVDKFKAKDDYVCIDWQATRRLGKRVPLTNLHSFGHIYKIKFFPNPRVHPLKNYAFKGHRILNRMLAANIKQNLREYINIERNYFSKRFNIDNYLKTK